MTRREFLGSVAAAAAPTHRPPNILLILADDMGFSDLGCYGSEIATPHLDQLAQKGARFSQFYNCARCCPSRASLLTGLYPHQAGVGHMVDKAGPPPGYANDLSPKAKTIAEVLRAAGYQTGMSGKWHVTPVNSSKHNWPLQRGFDRYYGIIHGAADYYNPVTLTCGNEFVEPSRPDYFFTDALASEGIRFMDEFARAAKPWFLYTAFTAPHWPLHARRADVRKYEDVYRMGWDAMREARHQRQLDMGMLARRWEMTSRDTQVTAWKDAKDKEWQVRRMAVYAAQVEQLDRNIGRLLTRLRESGQEDNTLVLFMSDNGGCAEEVGPRWTGRHVPTKTRDGRPVRVGNNPTVMPGPEDTYQSYGVGWANASNTPFRLYKHWVHEGGIATPLIARWPAAIEPAAKFIDTPAHFIDIMATCADAGSATPTGVGRSLLPLIHGRTAGFDRTLYWEHEGNCAVRKGKWKLVRKFPGDWELYDMEKDRTELHPVHARAARGLAKSWDKWAASAGVLPWAEVEKQQTNR